MSPWKWRQVYSMSTEHGVGALLSDGVRRCSSQFYLQLPDDLTTAWQQHVSLTEQQNRDIYARQSQLFADYEQLSARPILLLSQAVATLYDHPLHRNPSPIDIYFPFDTQGKRADRWAREHADEINDSRRHTLSYTIGGVKAVNHHRIWRLTNKLTDHTLQGIIEKEFRENSARHITVNGRRTETIQPTLSLMVMLMRIANSIISEGIPLVQLIDLGTFLRKAGDQVDFVKIDTWTQQLHLSRMAQLTGVLLTGLLGFTPDEVPFMTADSDQNIQRAMQEISRLRKPSDSSADSFRFSQGNGIFVHATGSSSMLGQARRSARYFRYYPAESITSFFAAFAHSLTHIEE